MFLWAPPELVLLSGLNDLLKIYDWSCYWSFLLHLQVLSVLGEFIGTDCLVRLYILLLWDVVQIKGFTKTILLKKNI